MPSSNRIQRHRARALAEQDGRCFYCGVRVWLRSPEELPIGGRGDASLAKLRCTAEHLIAQCDGGTHAAANIVAACARCNHARHRLRNPPPPPAYRLHVFKKVAGRCWHEKWVYEAGLTLPHPPSPVSITRPSTGQVELSGASVADKPCSC